MQTTTVMKDQLQKAHSIIDEIFRNILPKHDLSIREAQVQLSHDMLDAFYERKIAMADAGVGIGKTYAYLVAVIVHHIYLPESMWVRTSYRHDSKFNMNTPLPVVISTSSIALQKAIVHEYIPFISTALMESGIIENPLQCVVRKGKNNYVCDLLLRHRLVDIKHKQMNLKQREALTSLSSIIDLDKVQGLSSHDRKQICVPSYCSKKCSETYKCRYQRLLKTAKSPNVFFQICNHK